MASVAWTAQGVRRPIKRPKSAIGKFRIRPEFDDYQKLNDGPRKFWFHLTELDCFIRSNHLMSPNCRQPYQFSQRTLAAPVESAMNSLVNQRTNKRGQMRWSAEGAARLPCRVCAPDSPDPQGDCNAADILMLSIVGTDSGAVALRSMCLAIWTGRTGQMDSNGNHDLVDPGKADMDQVNLLFARVKKQQNELARRRDGRDAKRQLSQQPSPDGLLVPVPGRSNVQHIVGDSLTSGRWLLRSHGHLQRIKAALR